MMDATLVTKEHHSVSVVAVAATAGAEIVTMIESEASGMMRVPRMARKGMVSPMQTSAQSKPPPSDANAEMNGANPLKMSETPQRNQRGKQRRKRGQRQVGRTLLGTAREDSPRRREAARLRAMMDDAQVHDEARWKRLRKNSADGEKEPRRACSWGTSSTPLESCCLPRGCSAESFCRWRGHGGQDPNDEILHTTWRRWEIIQAIVLAIYVNRTVPKNLCKNNVGKSFPFRVLYT